MAKSKKKLGISERRLSSKLLAKQRWQQRQTASRPETITNISLEVESDPPFNAEPREERCSDQSECPPLSECIRGKEVEGEGRYIVNISYMVQQMQEKFDNHDPLSNCTFGDMVQTKTRRYGLQTQIFFQCRVCYFEDSIWTDRKDDETMDINRCAVAGTIAIGIGFSQLEELMASMSVPCMSIRTYRKYDMEIIAAFEKAAHTEKLRAGEIAKKHALERGDFIIHDGIKIPFISVVADCSWMKRSYKTGKYDSLSGVAAIVDQHTKKVIFTGVRNKFCSICEWAARHDITPKDHVCFKNWGRDQASTGMESDALLEGFKTSMETHGLIYKTLIADGDSSVYKSIVDNDPYSKYGIVVEKKECVNHLLRNLARKIRDVAKTKGRNISRQKKVVDGSVLNFRRSIEKAILHRQGDVANTDTAKIDLLKKDVLNMPYHVFGDHRKCNELNGFCHQVTSDDGIDAVENLKKAGLFQQLEDAITYLSFHADSLLYHATNNIAESFNAIVCKLIGGKRVNFGPRGSFQARCAGSVLQHNTQNILTKLHESEGKKPPSTATALEARRQHKVRKNAEIRKRWRESRAVSDGQNKRQRGQDKNYGPNAQKPDMPDYVYDDLVMLHEGRLLENQKNRVEIESCTRGQADNALWQSTRRKILTASNFGKVCRMRDTTSCSGTVQSIIYPTMKSTPAMVWGRTNEAKAIEDLQKKLVCEGNPVIIRPCGLFIDPDLAFLGASPDGVIDDTTIVEVKCPKSAQVHHPDVAIQQGVTEVPKYFDRNDPSKMNTSHHYYYQVQGQLHVTRADTCYFVVWSPLGLKYVKVSRDDTFWNERMEPYLTRFYNECMLPEIIDGRYIRKMPIREPKYVQDARQQRSQTVQTSATAAHIDDNSLSTALSMNSESETENMKDSYDRLRVQPIKLSRTNPKDPDSWSVTSSDEQHGSTERESKVKPLRLTKRTSKDRVSWVVSSSDEHIESSISKARIPPLKLKRSSQHEDYWAVSSTDNEESEHRQLSCGTRHVAVTPRASALTEAANGCDTGIPWVVISEDRVTKSPTLSEIDILESVNQNVEIANIRKDVLSQKSLLNDTSIDQFLAVLNEASPFNTATSLWLAHQRFIKPSQSSQDIHIIGGNAFRHWRCTYFDGTQLFVYDSLGCSGYQSLKMEEKRFISLRYPNLQIKDVLFPVVQKQPDNFSCGVFAAAFATTVALGGNPTHETYSTDVEKLRNHLMRIIEGKILFAFPSE